jgi:hypothetical protein
MAINPLSFTQPQAFSGGVDFSPLANLGNVAREAQKRESLADLGKQLAAGKITYEQAAGRVGELGDIGSSLKFLDLAEARRLQDLQIAAAKDFSQSMQGAYGGGGATSPSRSAAPEAEPAQTAAVPPREPTPEIPGVVRTNPDGTLAGNMTAPTLPAAAPAAVPAPTPAPGTPIPMPRPPEAGPPRPEPPPVPRDTAALPPNVSGANAEIGMLPPEQRLPILMRAAASPFLPTAQREVAKSLLTATLAEMKPQDRIAMLTKMREDDPALANKSLFQIEKELKGPLVQILPGEKAQDVELNTILGKHHGEALKDALGSGARKASLDMAERAMMSKDFYSGTMSPAVTAVQRAAVALGIADADKAGANELFQKIQNKTIMDSGGASSGLGPQISNNDAKIIANSTLGSQNTPDGNRKIIAFNRLMEDRKVAYAQELNNYANSRPDKRLDINVLAHMKKWVDDNPLNFSKVPGLSDADIKKAQEAELPPITVNPNEITVKRTK